MSLQSSIPLYVITPGKLTMIETNHAKKILKPNLLQKLYREWLLILIMTSVLLIDQITKLVIISNLYRGEAIPQEGLFRIKHTINTGSAFGLFHNQTVFLIFASFIGVGILVFLYRQNSLSGMLPKVSLGLQLGGAIGNLLDRIRYGYVVDFIQLGFWPVFNIADSCIVIGIILLSFILLRSGKSTPNQNSDPENYDSNPNTHPPDKT